MQFTLEFYMQVLRILFLALWLAASALADLRVGTLNCFFLVDPARPGEGQLQAKTPAPEIYVKKVENLSSLLGDLDFVGLQEIGSEREASALARLGSYTVRFAQGKDTYTGQDVAALVRNRPDLSVNESGRSDALESLSKHLVVRLTESGNRYCVLVVHLIRPIGKNADKHARQLTDIRAWVADQRANDPKLTIIVLGDFNNGGPDLLPLTDSGRTSSFAATHQDGKAIDRIFTSGHLTDLMVTAPPIPRRANKTLLASWTDHFLVSGTVAP